MYLDLIVNQSRLSKKSKSGVLPDRSRDRFLVKRERMKTVKKGELLRFKILAVDGSSAREERAKRDDFGRFRGQSGSGRWRHASIRCKEGAVHATISGQYETRRDFAVELSQ